MKIELPPELVQSAVASIILDRMTEEQRQGILAASLAHLVEPTRNAAYPHKQEPSPLQAAFNNQAANMLCSMARERLETDERFRAQIDAVIEECLARFFAPATEPGKVSPREALVDKIVEGMAKAFERDRW